MQTGLHTSEFSSFGYGGMWEPGAYDGQDALFAGTPGSMADGRFLPYCAKDAPVVALSDSLSESYYTVPKATGKPYLSAPTTFTSNGTAVAMSTASYPVMVDGTFRGTVVDLSLQELDALVSGISVYGTGYAGLLTSEGLVVVVHREYNLVGKNLYAVNRFFDPVKARAAMKAGTTSIERVKTQSGFIIRYDQPIPLLGTGHNWYIALVVPLDEILAEAHSISTITLTLSAITLLLRIGIIFILTLGGEAHQLSGRRCPDHRRGI